VKLVLVILTVIRSAETRSLVRSVLEGAGHRLIESGGYPQAQLLLNCGLHPDFLLVESIPAGPSETFQFRQLLKSAPKHNFCLILGADEHMAEKEASRLGIKHFLTRPVKRDDFSTMISRLNHPVEQNFTVNVAFPSAETIETQATGLSMEVHAAVHVEELGDDRFFLAASPQMLEVHRQVKLLADVDVNVLILGESGTGKEVIAHLIHKYSRRSRHKLMNVNCAALPADLLESELFGYQQGAFTGAVKDRAGKFEQANGSTLLLDEIGDMSVLMQAKLLHVLQDGQFTRLGGQESTKVDVRVLAATNVQIESALLDKTFREDLYYRLSAFTINVPPLRERREEISYLIEETIRRAPAEMKNSSECSFSSRLMDAALLYDWRGNLRELRNFVTRTIIIQDHDAAIRELETKIAATSVAAHQESSAGVPYHGSAMRSIVRDFKDRTEVHMIQDALDASGWNRRRAAQQLNISYRTLLYKIQQHHLTPRMPKGVKQESQAAYSVRRNAV
jgi:two-component system, NtrC family, response regulator AtoC